MRVRKAIVSAALGAAVLAVGVSPAPAANNDIDSTVTAKANRVNERARIDGYYASGYVKSPASSCQSRREVQIWKSRPGPDRMVEQTVTFQGDGYWETYPAMPLPAGTYYAVAERMVLPNNKARACARARSPEFEVPELPAR